MTWTDPLQDIMAAYRKVIPPRRVVLCEPGGAPAVQAVVDTLPPEMTADIQVVESPSCPPGQVLVFTEAYRENLASLIGVQQ